MARLDDTHESEQHEQRKARGKLQRDVLCSHTAGNLRCVLPATWYAANSFHGYCRLHDEDDKRLTGPEGYAQLEHIRDHRASYLQDFYGPQAELVTAVMQAHPEWLRGEDEGRTAYQDRMLEAVAKLNPAMASMIRRKRAEREQVI